MNRDEDLFQPWSEMTTGPAVGVAEEPGRFAPGDGEADFGGHDLQEAEAPRPGIPTRTSAA